MMANRYSDMKSRTFVAAAGGGLGATVAGCFGNGPNDEGNGSDENGTEDPGNGPDGAPINKSEDPSGDGNDSDGTEGDDPNGGPDKTVYTVSLENDPVKDAGEFATLRVKLVDPPVEPGLPAAVETALTNTSEETMGVSSSAPSPFGVLWAESDDGESITLWNDAYEGNQYVGTDSKRVEEIDDIAVGKKIDAGGLVSRTFEIHEDTPGLDQDPTRRRSPFGSDRRMTPRTARDSRSSQASQSNTASPGRTKSTGLETPGSTALPTRSRSPNPPMIPPRTTTGTRTIWARGCPPNRPSSSRPSMESVSRRSPCRYGTTRAGAY